jgi:hypothetical protein
MNIGSRASGRIGGKRSLPPQASTRERSGHLMRKPCQARAVSARNAQRPDFPMFYRKARRTGKPRIVSSA